MLDKIMFLL